MENGVGVVLLTMLLTQSLFLVVRVFAGMVLFSNVCYFKEEKRISAYEKHFSYSYNPKRMH